MAETESPLSPHRIALRALICTAIAAALAAAAQIACIWHYGGYTGYLLPYIPGLAVLPPLLIMVTAESGRHLPIPGRVLLLLIPALLALPLCELAGHWVHGYSQGGPSKAAAALSAGLAFSDPEDFTDGLLFVPLWAPILVLGVVHARALPRRLADAADRFLFQGVAAGAAVGLAAVVCDGEELFLTFFGGPTLAGAVGLGLGVRLDRLLVRRWRAREKEEPLMDRSSTGSVSAA